MFHEQVWRVRFAHVIFHKLKRVDLTLTARERRGRAAMRGAVLRKLARERQSAGICGAVPRLSPPITTHARHPDSVIGHTASIPQRCEVEGWGEVSQQSTSELWLQCRLTCYCLALTCWRTCCWRHRLDYKVQTDVTFSHRILSRANLLRLSLTRLAMNGPRTNVIPELSLVFVFDLTRVQ